MAKTGILKIFILAVALTSILILMPGCCVWNPGFSALSSDKGEKVQNTDSSSTADDSAAGSADTSIATETTEPVPVSFYYDDKIPDSIKYSLDFEFKKDFDGFNSADSRETADVLVEILPAEQGNPDYKNSLIYVPAVTFRSFFEESSSRDFAGYWNGSIDNLKDITGSEIEPGLIIRSSDLEVIEKSLGQCRIKQKQIVGDEADIAAMLENNINSFTIIPFDKISPKIKPVNIDGISVFDKNIVLENYPFVFSIGVKSKDAELMEKARASLSDTYLTNRDPSKLVTVIMTGVTALTRNTAVRMDRMGILYPAYKITHILQNADITHISDEVSFVEGSNAAKTHTMVFCSRPEYIELIKYIGTDVVEITGNHLNDYGSKWLAYTLDIFDKEGLPYFGGGRNLEDAYEPAIFEVNGYRIAFVGANSYGPASVWAGEDTPGTVPVNMWDELQKEKDMQKMKDIVKDLKSKGYIVIFTFQYMETDSYHPMEEQVGDFRAMIDAGADIVSGSQAHQPMGVEFWKDGFINYGLGNLFFDQMQRLGVRQGIIAKHVFYKGEHINTVLITTMLEDYCQPRPTYGTERAELFNSIFNN